jgi:hypothetical protein
VAWAALSAEDRKVPRVAGHPHVTVVTTNGINISPRLRLRLGRYDYPRFLQASARRQLTAMTIRHRRVKSQVA